MSKKYATKQFEINQSTLLIRWLVIIHGMAAFVVLFTSIPFVYKVISVSLILFSLTIYLKQEKNLKTFIVRYSSAFGWEVSDSNYDFESIEILPSTVLTPYMVFLHFRIQSHNKQKNKVMLILKDTLTNDEFRKLRVELKISGLRKTFNMKTRE